MSLKCPVQTAVAYSVAATAAFFAWTSYRRYRDSKSIHRYDVQARYSEAIRYGDFVFISGQVGGGANIEEATKEALSEVDAALAKAGTDKTKILECTVWLKNIADYDGMNAVYDAWIAKGKPPCRATVEARLAKPEWLVEIRVIATREDFRG